MTRREHGFPSVLGIAVNLLLAVFGGETCFLATTDDAAITIADAGAQAA